MAGVPRQTDFGSRMERLEAAVRRLERQSTLSSASISEGNLTIRRGGSLRIIDGGSIVGEGAGNLKWEGTADFGGDTHIGGDLTIDGNTTLGGNLTFGDDVIPPEALKRRTEARTFSSNGSGQGNVRTQSVTVTVPTWAQTTSCMAFGISSVAASPARANSKVTIAGNEGIQVDAASDLALAVPAAHARDFSPAGGSTFTVSVFGGLAGITSSLWFQTIVVMCVFTRQS